MYLITSYCSAQWLRDTANQLAHYHSLLGQDKELATLVKAVINNEVGVQCYPTSRLVFFNCCVLQARYISEYPYCGAFQPPPESGLSPTINDWATGVTVNPYALVAFYWMLLSHLNIIDQSTTKRSSSARYVVV